MSKTRRFTRGILLLSQAMVAASQTREEAVEALGVTTGHLSHILGGTRGLGLDLANKIKAVYGVPTEAWGETASRDEQLLIRETVEQIPRRPVLAEGAPDASPGAP